VVAGELPGWPVSASALFDRLTELITREHLLRIAGSDPFGAHQHFPILARIRLSGRVPPRLAFDPGEALRLTRWGSGDRVDHVARAWCCAILVIAPGDPPDELVDVVAPLVASCLVLGGDVPELAERLLAWRAVTAEPPAEPAGGPDPVALLGLLLLRAAAAPDDGRLPGLARAVADAYAGPAAPPSPMDSASSRRWRELVDAVLAPARSGRPEVDRLVAALVGR
jgi:hypothetical protein